MYMVYWTKTDGASYTNAAPMMVVVGDTKESVDVAGTVKCSKGGRSVPIVVSSSAVPHTDVTVTMVVVPIADPPADPYPSAGLTPDSTVVTLSVESPDGVLGFACDATAEGTTLNYVLAGTDAASFTLSSATATVTVEEAGTEVASPLLTIAALEAPDSTAASL